MGSTTCETCGGLLITTAKAWIRRSRIVSSGRFDDIFRTTNWNVITLKYGKKLEAAYAKPGGDALEKWIDECPNSLYSALTYKGGKGFRERLLKDIGKVSGIKSMLDEHDDDSLGELMTDLAGHDMERVLEAFKQADPERPNCFIAYTVKGKGMPFAGHKDNHAGLMTPDQMNLFRDGMGIAEGTEWEPFAGLDVDTDALQTFIDRAPFLGLADRNHIAPRVVVPANFPDATRWKSRHSRGLWKNLKRIGTRRFGPCATHHYGLPRRVGFDESRRLDQPARHI